MPTFSEMPKGYQVISGTSCNGYMIAFCSFGVYYGTLVSRIEGKDWYFYSALDGDRSKALFTFEFYKNLLEQGRFEVFADILPIPTASEKLEGWGAF